MITRKSASPHITLDSRLLRGNIKVKDIHRQAQRRASIGDIDYARQMALHRSAAQQQVNLVVGVAVAAQVLDDAEAGLAVGDGGIEVVLLAVLVDAEAFKVDVAARSELRLDGAGAVDGRLDLQRVGVGAGFQQREFDCDDAGHLDGAAEGDFAVALC